MESIARLLATHAIALLMLSVGLRATPVVKTITRRWPVLVRALCVVWIAVPAFAALVIVIMRPSAVATTSLMVMAICPGVPLVVRRVKRERGDPDTTLLILIGTA